MANITDGLPNTFYHAVVIYALENNQYKIKDSQGRKYKIPKNRCTSMQVQVRLLTQTIPTELCNNGNIWDFEIRIADLKVIEKNYIPISQLSTSSYIIISVK